MGLTESIPSELIGRQYRILTKDQLTFSVYNICKDIFAKWCFPSKKPEQVTQEEINNFLDALNWKSKTVPMNVISYTGNKSYNVPYDFYLRGLYRFSEDVEHRVGDNMEKLFFEKVLGKIHGDTSKCVNKLKIVKSENMYEYTFLNNTTNYNDANKQAMIDSILSIYSKCRNGAIILSSYKKGLNIGHRTLIFFENINNVLNIYYYDPHGSSDFSWSSKLNIYETLSNFFNEMKPYMAKYNLNDIVVKEHQTMCLLGTQTYAAGYDIGMCQIFSSLWFYLVVKVMAKAERNKIQLPDTEKWIYLIEDYLISQFTTKQMYNALLLFISRLFNYYTSENKNYGAELNGYNEYLLTTSYNKEYMDKFEVPFTRHTSSEDEVKEMNAYIIKLAEESIEESRLDEVLDKRIKTITIACIKDSKINFNIKVLIEKEINNKNLKISELVRNIAIKEFNEAKTSEDMTQLENSAKKIAIQLIRSLKIKDEYKKIAIEGITNSKVYVQYILYNILPNTTIATRGKRRFEDYTKEREQESKEYEAQVKRQKTEEEKYSKTLRAKIPFFSSKKLFDECKVDSDCLTGCCSYDDALQMKLCNVSEACPK